MLDIRPSAYLPCDSGVRQGEHLSPLLFSIFINDNEHFLLKKTWYGDNSLLHYMLMMLFYSDIQKPLNVFQKYC